MSDAAVVDQTFRGRSLAWLRVMLRCPPRWPSARDAAVELHEYIHIGKPIWIGSVCFFEMNPWGDVGLYVGEDLVLRLVGGRPVLMELSQDLSLIGWVHGDIFREASEGQLAH
jgi:hypothetical protein